MALALRLGSDRRPMRRAAQRTPEGHQRPESRGGSYQDAGGAPENRTQWSRRSMAKEMGIGQDSVGRIWRTFGVKPHVVRGFKLSKDPMFAEKVRDIVGLYLAPPD